MSKNLMLSDDNRFILRQVFAVMTDVPLDDILKNRDIIMALELNDLPIYTGNDIVGPDGKVAGKDLPNKANYSLYRLPEDGWLRLVQIFKEKARFKGDIAVQMRVADAWDRLTCGVVEEKVPTPAPAAPVVTPVPAPAAAPVTAPAAPAVEEKKSS